MSRDPPPLRVDTEDIVGDRGTLVSLGMAAVFLACVVFGTLRFVVHLTTGLATPYWGNAAGAAGIALLYLFCRADMPRRSSVAVHGTALMATIALLIPAGYGMTSSKWWLALVGFSVLLMGRRREAILWATITIVLVPLTALVETHITVANAVGEPVIERAMAGLFFVLVLLGLTLSFRRVAQRRARTLHETATSLDRANRVQRNFLAHMSHDLRTPLHGVIALTDLAKTGSASPVVHEQIAVAQQSAMVLLELLNNILDVTRAESGALDLDRRPFALHAALGELLRPFAAQAQARGISLVAESEKGVIEERVGDRTRVVQIVLNLLGNALKFTERGRVELRLRNVSSDADAVEIELTDTGRGIAPDKLARVFEPFQQVSASDSQIQSGAGLGLAIVRQLARCMDGEATVKSSVGEGSTFVVRIRLPPAEHAAAFGPEQILPNADPQPKTRRRGTTLRVLACEDNPVNRLAIQAMLASLGHDAVIVEDGEAAWKCLADSHFDVLVTDVEMPGLDGVGLTRRVREREEVDGLPRLPIIGATAHVGEAERHRLLDAEMDGHLPKPFTLAALAGALDRAARASEPSTRSVAAVAPATEPKIFDAEIVAELVACAGESRPLLIELAERFEVESARVVGELRVAGSRGDRSAVSSLAHSLVSSAATLGLSRVASIARAVETSERMPSASVAAQLEFEAARAASELLAFAREHSGR